jgi:hypothetical protein
MNLYLHRSLQGRKAELEQAWSAFQAELARDIIVRGRQAQELGEDPAEYFAGVLRCEIESNLGG